MDFVFQKRKQEVHLQQQLGVQAVQQRQDDGLRELMD